MTDVRHERIARNEASFREINDTLSRGLSGRGREAEELAGFVCECADRGCDALVHVELGKYEEVRSHPARFVIVPGHEVPDAEDVIEQGGRYAVVQKHPDAAPIAERTDPRSP